MACQYGRFVTRTEWNCSLHVHAPIYFDNEERYGLKEPTITALLKSEMRGQDIAEDFEENLSKQGLYMQDERECLNGIGDFNERFKTLVDITRRLSSKGY